MGRGAYRALVVRDCFPSLRAMARNGAGADEAAGRCSSPRSPSPRAYSWQACRIRYLERQVYELQRRMSSEETDGADGVQKQAQQADTVELHDLPIACSETRLSTVVEYYSLHTGSDTSDDDDAEVEATLEKEEAEKSWPAVPAFPSLLQCEVPDKFMDDDKEQEKHEHDKIDHKQGHRKHSTFGSLSCSFEEQWQLHEAVVAAEITECRDRAQRILAGEDATTEARVVEQKVTAPVEGIAVTEVYDTRHLLRAPVLMEAYTLCLHAALLCRSFVLAAEVASEMLEVGASLAVVDRPLSAGELRSVDASRPDGEVVFGIFDVVEALPPHTADLIVAAASPALQPMSSDGEEDDSD